MATIIFVQFLDQRVLCRILHSAVNGCGDLQAEGVSLATKGLDNFAANEFGGIQGGKFNLTLEDFSRYRLALCFLQLCLGDRTLFEHTV